jgi:molecular chaperone GrpE
MAKRKSKKVEGKLEDFENRLKRALADYANLEKRVVREKEDFVKLASAQLIDKLLPVLDDLGLCKEHLKDKGISLIYNRFQEVLESEGLEEIKASDEKFDPETMDCVELVSGPKNKVVEVVLKGYFLNGKVLRPAKVRVGQGDKSRSR